MSIAFDSATVPCAEIAGGVWTDEYLLRHCEGYIVDGPGGHLGFVSEVVATDDSLELVVDGASGEFRVPLEAIERFDPGAERVVVSAALRRR